MIRSPLLCLVGILLGSGAGPAVLAAQPQTGQPAPDFALSAFEGSNVRLSEYRGEVVVVTFWSSRCEQCAAQLAALDGLQATYGQAGLVTLAVNVDDDQQRASTFAREHALRIPLLKDPGKQVSRAFGVDRLPTTVLIDRSGKVRYLHRDFSAAGGEYLGQVRSLLDDSPN
ncbi:MAG TPA: TlpA disulfide reductase family protein [Steroidobacteraceae bacterium]|nr:TlpA disulfide reductase family protein [Steroidobacteraceae bacterium]